MSRVRAAVALVSLASAPSCLLTNDFWAFEDTAPVVAIERPEGFPGGGFGLALAAYERADGSGLLAVGGNPATDAFVFQTQTRSGEILPNAELSRTCADHVECVGRGFGSTFSWIRDFGGGTDCLAMGAAATDSVFAFCIGGNVIASDTSAEGGSSLGTSMASVPDGAEVFVGAPQSPEKVYVWPDDTRRLVGVGLGLGGTIGAALAAVRIDDATIRVAAGGGGEVVVFDWSAGVGTLVGATRTGGDGFGRALAWGDSAGDDAVELHVGGDGGVRVYSGADHDVEDALACDGDCSTFGDALAVGDVTGDGLAEVVVGWPGRPSGGETRSGAVAVFAHDTTTDPRILTDSTPDADEEVGRSVAVATVGDRGEIVAGAGGEIFWFLCSGLRGDDPQVGDRCR